MDLSYGIALSLHLGLSGNYNEIHPNIGLNLGDYEVGAYYNSVDNISIYGSRNFELGNNFDLDIGLATGYNGYVAPMMRFNYKDYFIMPTIETNKTYTDINGTSYHTGSEERFGIVIGKNWRF